MTDTNSTPQEKLGSRCADGGKCHHSCKEQCFRRQCCQPFSDYTGQWAYTDTSGKATPASAFAGYFYLDDGMWKQAGDPISFPTCTKLYTAPPETPVQEPVYHLRQFGGVTKEQFDRYVETGDINPKTDATILQSLRDRIQADIDRPEGRWGIHGHGAVSDDYFLALEWVVERIDEKLKKKDTNV